MPARQKIAFKPSLTLVLAEHLHDSPVRRQVIIPRFGVGNPSTIGDLERVLPTVRIVLVRAEKAKVLRIRIQFDHIT